MQYDFDKHVERVGTDCVKYDAMYEYLGRTDVKPMWVADMDFPTPPFVLQAINKRLKQQVLGYTVASPAFYQSIMEWQQRRHGVSIKKGEIHFVPGVVPGLHHSVCALTNKGDKILILTPVYHPFHRVIEINERQKVTSSLKIVDGRFQMDFEDIERKLDGCKMMFLCNPHNPGGTVWSKTDLERLAMICKQKGVIVISDEIHSDMTLPHHTFTPFVLSCPKAKDITITLNAPSKTFNMPGIQVSYYYIYNSALRTKLYNFLEQADVAGGNVFAYDCLKACYSPEGEDWLNQMLTYVDGNIRIVEDFLSHHCPKIIPMKTEASFLVFLDNRALPFPSGKELEKFYINEAHLGLNEGSMFGHDGEGFMRLNVALPRQELEQALRQLAAAYAKLGI